MRVVEYHVNCNIHIMLTRYFALLKFAWLALERIWVAVEAVAATPFWTPGQTPFVRFLLLFLGVFSAVLG